MFAFQIQPVLSRLDSLLPLAEDIRELSVLESSGEPGKWNKMRKYAMERLVWLAIEAVTDIGTMILDGLILRDAGSYEEIIQILELEQAISNELSEPLRAWVKLRQSLIGTSFQSETAPSDVMEQFGVLHLLLLDFHVSIHLFLRSELGDFKRS